MLNRAGKTGVLGAELAGLAMAMSSVSVVTNALTLRFFRPQGVNFLSKIVPVLIIVVFTAVFLTAVI